MHATRATSSVHFRSREVERAAAEIGSLRTAFDRGTPPAHDDLKTAADGLTVILRRSRTSVDKELKAVKDTADKLIETMTELLGAAAAAQELQKARDDGDKNGAPADGFLDDGAFKSVEAEISALHTAVGSGASPAPASLQAVADRLAAILKAYKTGDAELKQVNDAAEKLSETQGRLTELVKDADSDTAHQLRSVLERNSRIAYDNPRRRAWRIFGFWPRNIAIPPMGWSSTTSGLACSSRFRHRTLPAIPARSATGSGRRTPRSIFRFSRLRSR